MAAAGKALTSWLPPIFDPTAAEKTGRLDRPSPEVKVLLPGLIGSIPAFQFAENYCRQDGKHAKDKKCLVQAVNHLARI
jgi:hypothetical protein